MQFEFDPERLIEEVKKRPGIWNYDDPDYKNRNMRHKLWSEVVSELMQGDFTISKTEMRELEIQLQKKWKSIRDCFRKYVSYPNKTGRPYIYSKQLQFLIRSKSNPEKAEVDYSSDTDDSANKSKSNKWRKKLKVKLAREDDKSSDDDDNSNVADNQDYSIDNLSDDAQTPPAKLSKATKTPVQLDEFVFANVDAQTKSESDDPDKMFLLSLLPHLKSVPEENRLSAKMELMQVLQNANYKIGEYKIL